MIKEQDMNGPCPKCGNSSLKKINILYAAPLIFDALCESCGFQDVGEGEPIKVMEGEEAVRKRPELYAGCEEWHDLSRELILEKAKKSDDKSGSKVLDILYQLCSINLSKAAVDYIIDYMDDNLNDEEFDRCDGMFESADVDKLDDACIVSMLGITLRAKDKLSLRSKFYDRSFAAVENRRGLEVANDMLGKYK